MAEMEGKKLNKEQIAKKSQGFNVPFKHRHEIALQELEKINPGKLLEIGCGDGKLLEKASKQGFDCVGADFLSEFVEKGKEKGLEIVFCDVDNGLVFEDSVFDVVICLESIAHFVRPLHVLKEFKRVLKPGGVLLLESLNSAYWKYRFSLLFGEDRFVFPNNLLWKGCEGYGSHYELNWCEHKGLHLHHFSLASMKRFLESIGFKVEDKSRKIGYSKFFGFISNNFACADYFFVAVKN